MKKHSHIVLSAVVASLLIFSPAWTASCALAQTKDDVKTPSGAKERKPDAEKKGPAPVIDLKLVGTVEKLERKLDDGKVIVLYLLRTSQGMLVRLPFQEEIQYEGFVGTRVSVEGKGIETEEKGKKLHNFRKILKIEKLPDTERDESQGSASDAVTPEPPKKTETTDSESNSENSK